MTLITTSNGTTLNVEATAKYDMDEEAEEVVLELVKQITQLQEEITEQCRLHGIGAERELRLITRMRKKDKEIDQLKTRVQDLEKAIMKAVSLIPGGQIKADLRDAYDLAPTQSEGRYACPVITAQCDHYIYQCDSNGEVAICHCTHPDNPDDREGNCTHTLCPLTKETEK